MTRLLTLLCLLAATPAWAVNYSYYHIPASAFRPALSNPATTTCSGGVAGRCTACTMTTSGANVPKTEWLCPSVALKDAGITTDVFSLPPFALSREIQATVVFSDSDSPLNPPYNVGFYGYFEVTPQGVGSQWADNDSQICGPSPTTQVVRSGGNVDTFAAVVIQTCRQSPGIPCVSVVSCTGDTGYHGVLTIRRDMTTVSPSPNSIVITEVIVRVQTP